MLLFGITDIRLFWSKDARFLSQFSEGRITRFVPFSKHPPCFKDIAFWLRSPSSAADGGQEVVFSENDLMEVVRGTAGDLVEDVKLVYLLVPTSRRRDSRANRGIIKVDDFTHPETGHRSLCFRINYRSLERTLRNTEINELQQRVKAAVAKNLGVEMR